MATRMTDETPPKDTPGKEAVLTPAHGQNMSEVESMQESEHDKWSDDAWVEGRSIPTRILMRDAEPRPAPDTEDPLVAWFALGKNVKQEKPKPRRWRKSIR